MRSEEAPDEPRRLQQGVTAGRPAADEASAASRRAAHRHWRMRCSRHARLQQHVSATNAHAVAATLVPLTDCTTTLGRAGRHARVRRDTARCGATAVHAHASLLGVASSTRLSLPRRNHDGIPCRTREEAASLFRAEKQERATLVAAHERLLLQLSARTGCRRGLPACCCCCAAAAFATRLPLLLLLLRRRRRRLRRRRLPLLRVAAAAALPPPLPLLRRRRSGGCRHRAAAAAAAGGCHSCCCGGRYRCVAAAGHVRPRLPRTLHPL